MGRLLLAGFFALTPGMTIWLGALGIYWLIQRLGRSDLYQKLRSGDGLA
jgi:hypothetical protein